jgi:hypothetical protein
MQVKITTEKDQLAEEMQLLNKKLEGIESDIKELVKTIKPETETSLDYSYYEPTKNTEEVDEENKERTDT